MKAAKLPTLFFFIAISSLLIITSAMADSRSKLSNIFTLDTRTDDFPPVDGWQILTNKGDTYNEDLLIDHQGKVWCFYLRSPGTIQPVYLKIFESDGYLYKQEQIVGYSSNFQQPQNSSIRAAENDSTGDVWVAIQGKDGGYFVIFDSTGTLKQDSTVLSKTAFLPKIAPGRDGNMWFSWHTQIEPNSESMGKIACYNSDSDRILAPMDIGRHTYLMNTDIAVDDSNRVWTVLEANQSGDYFTRLTIFNTDMSLYRDGLAVSSNTIPLNTQRQIYSDHSNQRIWILGKNQSLNQQQLHLYSLDGTKLNTVNNAGDCSFARNEADLLEVIKFNSQISTNKTYDAFYYNLLNGNYYEAQSKFDSTYQFVRNGIAYNLDYPTLKVYAVQLDTNVTKLKFETVVHGVPIISVKAIGFDTTKISPTYRKQRVVSVRNDGNATLEVTNIIPHNQNFTVNKTSFEVLPEQSQNVTVQFVPTHTDTIVDYILFLSNDPNHDSLKVSVSGRGYKPTIPIVKVNQDSLIFDTIILGNAQTKYLYVYNDDKYEPLKVSSIKSSNQQFKTPDSSGFTLKAKESRWVPVVFKPIAIGNIVGTLTINSNDTLRPNLKVHLRGTGMRFGTPEIAVQPDSLDFGQLALGNLKSLYLEIENKGDDALQIENISVADSQFTSNAKNFSIPAHSKYYILITYHAKRLGFVRSKVKITSNDILIPEYFVPVKASARITLPPTISIAPDSLNFGETPLGSSMTRYFWISNQGEALLNIRNIISNNPRFVVNPKIFSVNAGYPQAISVTFTPIITAKQSGYLTIVSDDTTNDTTFVKLEASGRNLTPPKMVINPTSLNFGTVSTSGSLTKTFTIYNEGEMQLEAALSATNSSYTISPSSFTVPYKQYRTVYVTFAPKQKETITGNIKITSNNPPDKFVALQGTGRDPSPQQIYVSNTFIDFDSVAISNAKSKYFWIKNTGERALTVSKISTQDTSFIINLSSFTLNPGQSQYVLIYFMPSVVKTYQDVVTIRSDDPDEQYKYINIRGIGRLLRNQNIMLSNQTLAFGEIPITRERTMNVTINNTGEKELTISNISNKKKAFTLNSRQFTISPQSNATVYVTFTPDSIKSYQDTLKITSDDPDSRLVSVALAGSGRNLTNQKIAVYPDSLNFGSVGSGLSVTQNIQIRNEGEKILSVDSIKINNKYFSFDGNQSYILQPGNSNWLAVSFRPDSVGNFSGKLSIYSNDSKTPLYLIPLVGKGRKLQDPNITFYPVPLNFESVAVGKTKTMQLYVGNNGEKDLSVTNIVSNDEEFQVQPTAFVVKPGLNQTLNVVFQPRYEETSNARLTVMSNDPDSNLAFVPMIGTGRALQEPRLSYSPEQLNFGEVVLNNSSTRNITVQNFGDLPLRLFQISAFDTHFVANIDTALIPGGEYINFSVTFTPRDTTNYQSSLEIRSNDPSNYYRLIPLTGKGKSRVQQIVVSPPALDFKEVRLQYESTNYLWIGNLGSQPLTITNIISSNKHFVPQLTSFTLEHNQNRHVPIKFTPDSLKAFKGKLTIVSNDPVAPNVVVPLTGTGRDSLYQKIVASKDSLYFGPVAIQNTKTLSVTISNTGERTLKILNIISTNAAFAPHVKSFQVLPNASQVLSISFVPTATITYLDSLRILSNDPAQGTLIIKLKGIGIEPLPQKIAVSDTLLQFGKVPTDRSKSMTLTIYNQGEKNLEIFEFLINKNQFSVDQKWLIIKPGQFYYVTVTYAPQSAGAVTAYLTVKSNDPKKPEQRISLTGTGEIYTGPKIALQSATINFGATLVGVTKKLPLWIINSSKTDILKITQFANTNQSFAVSPTAINIAPQDSGAIQILFRPQYNGNHSANITITSNDKYQTTLALWVYGYAIEENIGENYLADLGWKGDGFTPVGDFFSPSPHTDSLLSSAPDRAWFIKDVFIYEELVSAIMNINFNDQIQLFINGNLVSEQNSSQALYWNIANLNVKRFLKFGRNRISIRVWNTSDLGGFDCELIVNGVARIRRGDQNWTHPDATWNYFGQMGLVYPNPPTDSPFNRLWFHYEYGLADLDSITANWAFEPTGKDTLYDGTPYGQKAVLHNINWIQGIIGQAMQFSGLANSYVELFTNYNRVPQTTELWFNCYGQRTYRQNIITNKGAAAFGQGLFISPAMRLGVYYYDGEYLTNFVVNPNTWYFISTMYKSDKILVYVNNVLVGSVTYAQGNPVGSSVCYLGGNPESPDLSGFYGAIDELQIRNTETMPTQMQEVATISIDAPDYGTKGTQLELNFDIYPTRFKILSGYFEYSRGGNDNFRKKRFTKPDSIYSSPLQLTIPADSVDIRGLKYRITLQTDYGQVQYPGYEPLVNDYAWLDVVAEKENWPYVFPKKIHRMISVPYVLDEPSVQSVLVDNLGAQNAYKWRLFKWNETDTHYVAYDDTTNQWNYNFTPGEAFWLITKDTLRIDAGRGHSPSNESFRINLKPGWNMIGTPFPYPVSWNDVEKTSNLLSDPIYRTTTDSIGWVYNTEVIKPGEGYFVWNGDNTNRSLVVPPVESSVIALKKQRSISDAIAEKCPDLSVLIAADMRCGNFMDKDNLFGVSESAFDRYDQYDVREAPAIGDYVSLWINNYDWESHRGAYTVDMRKHGSEGYVWNLVIDYSIEKPADPLTVKFSELIQLPENWLMYLFDLSEDVATNLVSQKTISIMPKSGVATQKKYKLVIGSEQFVKQNSENIPLVPMEFELFQNYPNPFNAATTISFNLPKRMQVSVKIYNILGQLAKTIVDEEVRAGNHKIQWDGRNNQGILVSTGVYIIRLEAKQNVAVKKLLLIK